MSEGIVLLCLGLFLAGLALGWKMRSDLETEIRALRDSLQEELHHDP